MKKSSLTVLHQGSSPTEHLQFSSGSNEKIIKRIPLKEEHCRLKQSFTDMSPANTCIKLCGRWSEVSNNHFNEREELFYFKF